MVFMITFESIKKEHEHMNNLESRYNKLRILIFKLHSKVLKDFEKETGLDSVNFYNKLVKTEYLSKYFSKISLDWVVLKYEVKPKSFFFSAIYLTGTVTNYHISNLNFNTSLPDSRYIELLISDLTKTLEHLECTH